MEVCQREEVGGGGGWARGAVGWGGVGVAGSGRAGERGVRVARVCGQGSLLNSLVPNYRTNRNALQTTEFADGGLNFFFAKKKNSSGNFFLFQILFWRVGIWTEEISIVCLLFFCALLTLCAETSQPSPPLKSLK